MAHNHSHASLTPADQGSASVFRLSIGLNLLYVIVETGAGFYYNSVSLLTDAGHNASDVGSLLLAMLAFRLAKKKSTSRYTYGYKKITVLSALANACLLLVAVGILGFETVNRLQHPKAVQGAVISWVAGLGIVINAFSAFLFYKNRSKDLNIQSAYLHLLADALVSVGVVVAGIAIAVTGSYILDPLIGLVVLIVILVSTWRLLTDSFRLAVDAVPEGIALQKIKGVIQNTPHVKWVGHVHVWAISTTENSLTAHVWFDNRLPFEEKVAAVKEIKHRLKHENIQHSTIEMETAPGIEAQD